MADVPGTIVTFTIDRLGLVAQARRLVFAGRRLRRWRAALPVELTDIDPRRSLGPSAAARWR